MAFQDPVPANFGFAFGGVSGRRKTGEICEKTAFFRFRRHCAISCLQRAATFFGVSASPVAADGRIANANAAAESFFEASLPLLRRHRLSEVVPFGVLTTDV